MSKQTFWALLPAAGVGKRMQADCPKQYLPLLNKTVLEQSLDCFLSHPKIKGVVLVLGHEDGYWPDSPLASHPKIRRAKGGQERFHSVLNGLSVLSEQAAENDWVLVHDAARPCLRRADLDRLLAVLAEDEVGGLLALPVRDTMKRATSDGEVSETVDREALWHALTPQMFRLGALQAAIEQCIEEGLAITDDASAMERVGFRPKLIEGCEDNIKITRPRDLRLAEIYLLEQRGELG
ncbi:MAG: 2-C-methyl-D-erythritol 4-phosphate cytidylyltransferase [Gammaproteobacteria bacterium]|nr:2-C-methyl-D-erythritol 4-phosphate cytidylyltransferase [Gammaproteobacteria bacterium]